MIDVPKHPESKETESYSMAKSVASSKAKWTSFSGDETGGRKDSNEHQVKVADFLPNILVIIASI